jgi:hypothetical protein
MARIYDFNDSVNLRGLGPVDVMMEDPVPGPHTGLILDMWKETKEGEGGKTTYRFNVTDTEPGSASLGVQTQIVVGCDWSKDFNIQHLINSLTSIGVKPEKLVGTIQGVSPAAFKGKACYFFVKAAPEGQVDEQGRTKRGDKNFLTPSMYEAAKKMETLRNATAPAATRGNGQAAAAVTPTAAPTVTQPASTPTPTPTATPATDLAGLFGS